MNGYAASKALFDDHVSRLNQLAELLSDTAAGLRNRPGQMNFSNTSGSLPIEARMSPDAITIDAMAWKPAAQIQQMLARWHDLRADLLARWSALPESARANLATPDGAADYILAADEKKRHQLVGQSKPKALPWSKS